MNLKYIYQLSGFFLLLIFATACQDKTYKVPTAKRELQNDCIKRSLGPNLVNLRLEFAYAMALPQDMGTIISAQVEASIPGTVDPVTPTNGTYLDHRAYSTDGGGNDLPAQIGNPSSTDGGLTQVIFTRDTFAVTLRYFYKVPPEARGQNLDFTFSATDSNGKTVSMKMGPYKVSNMDMALDTLVKDPSHQYFSIADMATYTAAQAAANPDKVDLVYVYRALTQSPTPGAPALTFKHALVSPAYLINVGLPPGAAPVALPAGVTNDAKIIKVALRDQQLARSPIGVFIDDLDFQNLDTSTASNFAINLKGDATPATGSGFGMWVETADGKYRAYIYFNTVTDASKTIKISIKRLQMF